MNMEKKNRKERDGREIMRRLDSDELMVSQYTCIYGMQR